MMKYIVTFSTIFLVLLFSIDVHAERLSPDYEVTLSNGINSGGGVRVPNYGTDSYCSKPNNSNYYGAGYRYTGFDKSKKYNFFGAYFQRSHGLLSNVVNVYGTNSASNDWSSYELIGSCSTTLTFVPQYAQGNLTETSGTFECHNVTGYSSYIIMNSRSTSSTENDMVCLVDSVSSNTVTDNGSVIDAIENGNKEQIDNANKNHKETIDKITDSDTSGASDAASGFFNDFDSSDYGLSDVITLPLQFIKQISSASCTPLVLPMPFVNQDVELPCMSTIYSKFGAFLKIYQTITFGVIAYWVSINIFAMVKGFKDPESDRIEVFDL